MTQLWKARLFRLWLIVGMPLAFWSAYEWWTAHKYIDIFQGYVTSSYQGIVEREHLGIVTENDALDPQKRFTEAVQYRDQAKEDAAVYKGITLALISFPIVVALLTKVMGWVWTGPSINPDKQMPSERRSWRNMASSKRAKWVLGTAAISAFTVGMFILRPESTAETLIEVGVQVIGLGLILLVIKLFRR